jgi:arsenical-resistance protein 2
MRFSVMSNTNTTEIQPDGAAEERPWHEAFPAPQAEARPINASAVLDLLKSSDGAKPSFVLVDVRRTDYEVCRIAS